MTHMYILQALACAVLHDKIYAVGGYDGSANLRSVFFCSVHLYIITYTYVYMYIYIYI